MPIFALHPTKRSSHAGRTEKAFPIFYTQMVEISSHGTYNKSNFSGQSPRNLLQMSRRKGEFVCFPVKTAVPALPVAAIRPASVGKPSRSSRQPSGKSKKYTCSSITSSAPQSPGSSPPCQPAGLSGDAEKQYISRETICYSFAKQRGADSCKLSAPCFLSYCPGSFPRTYFSGLWYLHYPAVGVLPAAPLDAGKSLVEVLSAGSDLLVVHCQLLVPISKTADG